MVRPVKSATPANENSGVPSEKVMSLGLCSKALSTLESCEKAKSGLGRSHAATDMAEVIAGMPEAGPYQVLAVATRDGQVRILGSHGEELSSLDTAPSNRGVHCLAVSPDGKALAAGLGSAWRSQESGDVERIHGEHDQEGLGVGGCGAVPLIAHSGAVRTISFSPCGGRVATGGEDRTVILWDSHGNTQRLLLGHTAAVQCVTWSTCGKHVASGSLDKSIVIWCSESGHVVRSIPDAHADALTAVGGVFSVCWSPDGVLVRSAPLSVSSTQPGVAAPKPPWRQPRGKTMVYLVNSYTNATSNMQQLWEIQLRFAPGLPQGWIGCTDRF